MAVERRAKRERIKVFMVTVAVAAAVAECEEWVATCVW
jgi:hypothetical protein